MASSFINFFLIYHDVWSFGRHLGIRLFLKIPENFIRIIFLDGFRFVHIPFGNIVKIQSLRWFLVDHLIHQVEPCFKFLQSKCATFAYFVINLSLHNRNLLLCCVYHYYYFCCCWCFTSGLTECLSLEFEWQQVSLSHQDSSQYTGRSQ